MQALRNQKALAKFVKTRTSGGGNAEIIIPANEKITLVANILPNQKVLSDH